MKVKIIKTITVLTAAVFPISATATGGGLHDQDRNVPRGGFQFPGRRGGVEPQGCRRIRFDDLWKASEANVVADRETGIAKQL
jgi:hypothetical protein